MAQTDLVIEDHANGREGLTAILCRHHYQVIAVENGRQARALLMTGTRPDVILFDMLLPVLAGWRLLARPNH